MSSIKKTAHIGSAQVLIEELRQEIADLRAKYDAHKHSFDGTQAASSITGTPVTGTTTGTAAGGVAAPAAAAIVTE